MWPIRAFCCVLDGHISPQNEWRQSPMVVINWWLGVTLRGLWRARDVDRHFPQGSPSMYRKGVAGWRGHAACPGLSVLITSVSRFLHGTDLSRKTPIFLWSGRIHTPSRTQIEICLPLQRKLWGGHCRSEYLGGYWPETLHFLKLSKVKGKVVSSAQVGDAKATFVLIASWCNYKSVITIPISKSHVYIYKEYTKQVNAVFVR